MLHQGNLKSLFSGHRNSSVKKEQKGLSFNLSKLTLFISYICEVDDENKNVKWISNYSSSLSVITHLYSVSII